MNTIAQYVAL